MFEKKITNKRDEDVDEDVSRTDVSVWLKSMINEMESQSRNSQQQVDDIKNGRVVEPPMPSREAMAKPKPERRKVQNKSKKARKQEVATLPEEGIRVTKDEKPQERCVNNKRAIARRNELRRAVIWSEIMPPKYKEY